MSGRILPPGESCLNRVVYKAKKEAIRKGQTYELTVDEHKRLILQNCHYCGVAPYRIPEPSFRSLGKVPVGGIDRRDSSIGYVSGNCLPSCERCNRAKGLRSYEEFTQMCIAIADHLTGSPTRD